MIVFIHIIGFLVIFGVISTQNVDPLPQSLHKFNDPQPLAPRPQNMRDRVPGMPIVPSNVHGLQSKIPAFPLDPTAHSDHSGGKRFEANVVSSSYATDLSPEFILPKSQPPYSDPIRPIIPPRPGEAFGLMSGPTSAFLPPNRLGLAQDPDAYKMSQNEKKNSWAVTHDDAFNAPSQLPDNIGHGQIIGPVSRVTPQSEPKLSITTNNVTPRPVISSTTSKLNIWDQLRVTSCNIYGHYYNLGDRVVELSASCNSCICTKFGVKCTKLC